VDYPLTAPDEVRPWRTAAFIVGAIALVETLILLVLGGGALAEAVSDRVQVAARENVRATQSRPQPAPRKPEKTPAAKVPRRKVAVVVLNGNGQTGAAAAAASRVRGEGYKIRSVGNAPHTGFPRSIVMFRPGFAGEGRRLARDLGVKQVGPLDGIRPRGLRGAQAVYIVGA
jgi:LytR cell envelope-related transcriptional attenuator